MHVSLRDVAQKLFRLFCYVSDRPSRDISHQALSALLVLQTVKNDVVVWNLDMYIFSCIYSY